MKPLEKLRHRLDVLIIIYRADRKIKRYKRALSAPKSPCEAYAPSRLDIIGGAVLAMLTAFSIHILRTQP